MLEEVSRTQNDLFDEAESAERYFQGIRVSGPKGAPLPWQASTSRPGRRENELIKELSFLSKLQHRVVDEPKIYFLILTILYRYQDKKAKVKNMRATLDFILLEIELIVDAQLLLKNHEDLFIEFQQLTNISDALLTLKHT